MPVDTMDRLKALRELMAKENVDAYIVPTDDQHASEYIAAVDQRREWITGFTGSAGTALVLKDEAHLFTDGRYHAQAAQELCSAWTLQKHGLPDVKSWQEYLATFSNARVGLDPSLISISDYQAIAPTLAESCSLVPLPFNLIDRLWKDQPPRPQNEVFVLGLEFAGQDVPEKLANVRKELNAKKATGIVVSMLDEICWLFNLRGSDIPYNPVLFAFAFVPLEGAATIFVDLEKLTNEAYKHLTKQGIRVEPYDSVTEYLMDVGAQLQDKETIITPSRTNYALCQAVGTEKITVCRSPVGDLKAIKNPVEIEGFRRCHIRDGVALVRYFSWLERQLNAGVKLSESKAAERLEEYRSELAHFRGLSFATISSTGANAAIIHYHPHPVTSAVIDRDAIYLCDSGAQFNDGTTDTTRTLHFGTPSAKEIRTATRVLQGHIAMDSLVFPSTATGYILDPFARQFLWMEGLDYRHGTGHGVGSFLNVHEGPHGIGTRITANEVKLRQGYTVSNEPGYYEDGDFGIRIENVLVVQPAESLPINFGNVGFLRFERFTMVPIQTKLIDLKLLSTAERTWINEYHAEVRTKVLPPLKQTGDADAVEYLLRETEAI